MEDELKANLPDIDCELIKGEGGVFEVRLDGEMIYKKGSATGCCDGFPEDGKITEIINSKK